MRNQLPGLHAELEAGWRRIPPFGGNLRAGRVIERRLNLNAIERGKIGLLRSVPAAKAKVQWVDRRQALLQQWWVNTANRRMIGIGTPKNKSKIDRMIMVSLWVKRL